MKIEKEYRIDPNIYNPPPPLGVSWRVRATSGLPLPTLPQGTRNPKFLDPGGGGGGYKSGRPLPGLPESDRFFDPCGHRFCFIDFPSILEANLGPKIDQNRSNIDVKMTSHVELIFGSIFD